MGTNQSTQNFSQPTYSNTQQFATNLLQNVQVKAESDDVGEVPSQRTEFDDTNTPSFMNERNWNEVSNSPPEEILPTQESELSSSFSSSTSDGYKWRKYGQKFVKGKPHPRSYYKCTFPGCSVKKYVEFSGVGSKQNIQYKGTPHTHDPSRITKLNAFDQLSFKNSVVAESLAEQNDSETDSELEEKAVNPTNSLVAGQANHNQNNGQRLVIETTADVDHLDDGYNWRKYGQKAVKGTSYLRAYYRCTEENCLVKKQVERRDNVIINTYDGTHNHLAPGFEETLSKGKRNKRKMASLEVGDCRASRKRTQLTTSIESTSIIPEIPELRVMPSIAEFIQ